MKAHLAGAVCDLGGVPACQLPCLNCVSARCLNCNPACRAVGPVRETNFTSDQKPGVALCSQYAPHRAKPAPPADQESQQYPWLLPARRNQRKAVLTAAQSTTLHSKELNPAMLCPIN